MTTINNNDPSLAGVMSNALPHIEDESVKSRVDTLADMAPVGGQVVESAKQGPKDLLGKFKPNYQGSALFRTPNEIYKPKGLGVVDEHRVCTTRDHDGLVRLLTDMMLLSGNLKAGEGEGASWVNGRDFGLDMDEVS